MLRARESEAVLLPVSLREKERKRSERVLSSPDGFVVSSSFASFLNPSHLPFPLWNRRPAFLYPLRLPLRTPPSHSELQRAVSRSSRSPTQPLPSISTASPRLSWPKRVGSARSDTVGGRCRALIEPQERGDGGKELLNWHLFEVDTEFLTHSLVRRRVEPGGYYEL